MSMKWNLVLKVSWICKFLYILSYKNSYKNILSELCYTFRVQQGFVTLQWASKISCLNLETNLLVNNRYSDICLLKMWVAHFSA